MPSDWTSVPSVEIHQPGVSTVSQGYGSAARRSEPQPASRGLEQAQAQIDQVITIMQDNMEKVLERDSKLTDLDYRAESLQAGAQQFEQSTGRIKRKYWWKNLKMMIILISIILIVITIIIVVIVTSVKSK